MPRQPIPLSIDDLARFARALAGELGDGAPSHQRLLHLLARTAGYRNHQELAADAGAHGQLDPPVVTEAAFDPKRVERALNHFDEHGMLIRRRPETPCRSSSCGCSGPIFPSANRSKRRSTTCLRHSTTSMIRPPSVGCSSGSVGSNGSAMGPPTSEPRSRPNLKPRN